MNSADENGLTGQMHVSARTRAELVQLRYATGPEINDLAASLVERGEALEQVEAILEKKISEGRYILSNTLAKLLGRTMSFGLYGMVQDQLHADTDALLTLYACGFPDPGIELHLCDQLLKSAGDDTDFRRRQIVCHMTKHGSIEVLPVLEAILYKHAPNLAARRAVVQAIESVGVTRADAFLLTLETAARSEFLKEVAVAIASIRSHPDVSQADVGRLGSEHGIESSGASERATQALGRARHFLSHDPATSLFHLRKGAEALCKEICQISGFSRKNKSLNKMMLSELMDGVAASNLPEDAKLCLEAVHKFGNLGAHDQGDQPPRLDAVLVGAVITQYESALSCFHRWRNKLRQTD